MVYTAQDFKNFPDFRAYCDVFNYHFQRIECWQCGVALIKLDHNIMAIYNGHNNKAYFIDLGKVSIDWVKDQYQKCADKYFCDEATSKAIQLDVSKSWADYLLGRIGC